MFSYGLMYIAILVLLLYLFLTYKWNFWKKKGIYQIQPIFPFGTHHGLFTKTKHINDHLREEANEVRDLKHYGGYFLQDPVWHVNDPDLVKQIAIKDFDCFANRTSTLFGKPFKSGHYIDTIWDKMIFMASGEEWKNVRTTFSPVFTSGKMKLMQKFMQITCTKLEAEFGKHADENSEIELRSNVEKYTTDVTASCTFGINANSFTEERSKFSEHSTNIFDFGFKFMLGLLPGGHQILRMMNMSAMDETKTAFFYEAIMTTLKYRRENKAQCGKQNFLSIQF